MCEGDYSGFNPLTVPKTSQDREQRIKDAVVQWDDIKNIVGVTFDGFLRFCAADIRDDVRTRILAQQQGGS